MKKIFIFSLFSILLTSCFESNPNLNKEGKDILESNEVFLDGVELSYHDTVYIPIYSDIYNTTRNEKFLLTATLSIRNTSLRDSMYVDGIDYYDTQGNLVREYIKEKTLLLTPMQSIEYVIEEKDNTGGTGANFIVSWGARNAEVRPVFQGVMISTSGQQGLSFITDGVSISVYPNKDSTSSKNLVNTLPNE